MKRILGILVMLFTLYLFAEAANMEIKEKKPVDIE